MTRINSAIPVQHLTDEHLLAEHREIKRLPACAMKYSLHDIPSKFCLGSGHVKFFLDKQKFILNRYKEIHQECLRRGFDIQDYSDNWNSVDDELMKDYTVTDKEFDMLKDRISQRILMSTKKCFHYHKKQISKEEAMSLLK